MKQNIFNKGIPTAIDTRKLCDAFGVPVVGKVITYEEVAKIIGVERGTHRFNTVLNAWRRKLDREHNVILVCTPNIGFKVADGHERTSIAVGKVCSGARAIRRGGCVASRTSMEGLSDEDKRAIGHAVYVSQSMLLARATAAKQIVYPDLNNMH